MYAFLNVASFTAKTWLLNNFMLSILTPASAFSGLNLQKATLGPQLPVGSFLENMWNYYNENVYHLQQYVCSHSSTSPHLVLNHCDQ